VDFELAVALVEQCQTLEGGLCGGGNPSTVQISNETGVSIVVDVAKLVE